MFKIIKKLLIVLLSNIVKGSNHTKCVLNQSEMYNSTYSY